MIGLTLLQDSGRTWMPEWFVVGGPVMWAILGCSLASIVVLAEKLWTLRSRAILQPDVARSVNVLARSGQLRAAAQHCAENPGPYAIIAAAALEAQPFGRDEVRQAVMDAGRQEEARLERHLPALRVVASVSPLLGLLGTVLGMIHVFQVVAQSGLGDPGQFSAGLKEALYTTVFGLVVAIPSLVIYEACRSRVERLLLSMEREIIDLVTTLTRVAEPVRERVAGEPA